MASTYVNNLRLNEMGTGDASGTWGTTTNTNLELIGEALGFGTEAITTNADTHTTTVADGASDAGRAMYLKYTGTLDSACTITIAPNTMKRMQFIENATSGSQNIIISQGSGANITIPPTETKAVYLDGAGSGAAVVDAFANLNVADLKVADDLTVTDDVSIGGALTLTGNGDFNGDLDVDGTTNLDVVDIDGAVDMASTLQVDGAITSSAGATITVADNSDNLTLTSTDADASVGPNLNLYRNSGSPADDDVTGVIVFNGRNDNSQDVIYARQLSYIKDASDGTEDGQLTLQTMVAGTIRDRLNITPSEISINEDSQDLDFRVESNGNANMLFVDAGNDKVGIGTNSPSTKLHVGGTAPGDSIIRQDSTGSGTNWEIGERTAGKWQIFEDDADSIVSTFTSTGRLGIGTDSPGSTLHVDKSFSGTLVTFHQTAGSSSADRGLDVETSSTGTTVQRWLNSGAELARLTGGGTLVISDTAAIAGTTFDARDVDNVTSLACGNNAGYVTRGQDTTAGANFVIQANRGTLTSPTNSNNGDNCGKILFRAYHTNGHYSSSTIRAFVNGANGTNDMPGSMVFETSADGSATPTERMRINPDGQVSFGTSSPLAGSRIFTLASASTPYGITTQNDATTGTMFVMVYHSNGGSAIGSITTSNTATAFNTSSDYRLKENIQPLENGLERLNNLKPVKFDWKEDGTSSEGFMAHEAQEVFPDAVTGEKDGEEMQGMDYGRITPLLVKAIQEQQEQIEQLKTEIQTLKGE